ncbi:hypothetical protein VAPA_2c11900 [Variovorax paradoxus B4]|uniref:Uncharacterized protein n=1 Tax=Variovorax paradoxus B4 TaxID=1246301 RepID=T1XN83_VARPD|nr:hypothetical protein VAPA_2c11900 [Variovorax paradoxus B4]
MGMQVMADCSRWRCRREGAEAVNGLAQSCRPHYGATMVAVPIAPRQKVRKAVRAHHILRRAAFPSSVKNEPMSKDGAKNLPH